MNHDRSEDREWKARRMRSGGKRKKTLETVREREQRKETKAKASWSSSEREKFRVPKKKKRKEIWGGLLPFLWLSLSVPLFFFLSFFSFLK